MLIASVPELAVREAVARVKASPVGWFEGEIRRTHQTDVGRTQAPRIHIVEGDLTLKGKENLCRQSWEKVLTIAIFLRKDQTPDEDDNGPSEADGYVIEILSRCNPTPVAWANGVVPEIIRIGTNTEIADADSIRIDIELKLCLNTGAWALNEVPE